MAFTNYYVDPAAGNDTTGDGSIGTPWATVQHALDTITRNSTDGDRINVKAGAADTLGAALSFSTYGTPTVTAPIVIRGYTATAGDGGIGEINGAGSYGIIAGGITAHLEDMKLGNCGSADVLDLGTYAIVIACEIYGTSGFGIDPTVPYHIAGCYFHDLTGTYAVDGGADYCYFTVATTTGVLNGWGTGNIIRIDGADTSVIGMTISVHYGVAIGNVIYSTVANTSQGIYTPYAWSRITNNIIVGFSGAGGDGIETAAPAFVGSNAYYNCTTNETLGTAKAGYTLGTAVSLAADPFTDAANGDFSLTAAAKAALADKGFPAQYLGAHANTDSHLNIGPIQLEAASGAETVVRRYSLIRR